MGFLFSFLQKEVDQVQRKTRGRTAIIAIEEFKGMNKGVKK